MSRANTLKTCSTGEESLPLGQSSGSATSHKLMRRACKICLNAYFSLIFQEQKNKTLCLRLRTQWSHVISVQVNSIVFFVFLKCNNSFHDTLILTFILNKSVKSSFSHDANVILEELITIRKRIFSILEDSTGRVYTEDVFI